MQTNRIVAIVGGAVLFILGLIIGATISGGPSVEEIDEAVGRRIEAAKAEEAERSGRIEAGLSQLASDVGGRLDGIAGSVDTGARSVADFGAKLGGEVEALGQLLHGAIDKSSADHLAALESGLAGLRGQLSAPAPAAGEAVAPAAAATPAAAAAPSAAPEEGHTPGQTVVLSDGALRVFVSRLDEAGGTAHVRVAGEDLALTLGKPAIVTGDAGECQVTLDALGGGKAALSGVCGDALPEPAGAAPGSVVDLAEGLRVFVSGVSDEGARIAVNGVQTVTLPVGEAIEAKAGDQTCRVSVDAVDRGRVALGYTCG
jgi:hypothetical protein